MKRETYCDDGTRGHTADSDAHAHTGGKTLSLNFSLRVLFISCYWPQLILSNPVTGLKKSFRKVEKKGEKEKGYCCQMCPGIEPHRCHESLIVCGGLDSVPRSVQDDGGNGSCPCLRCKWQVCFYRIHKVSPAQPNARPNLQEDPRTTLTLGLPASMQEIHCKVLPDKTRVSATWIPVMSAKENSRRKRNWRSSS